MPEDRELQRKLARVERLIEQAEALTDNGLRDQVRELVQHLLDFHGAGLARMVRQIAALGPSGRELLEAWTRDDLIASLLLLYDLHPQELEVRVRGALDRVRPYLQSHGGNVEYLGLAEGVVRLRMQGKCNGCPSSEATARSTIEEAIFAAAPEVSGIEVEGVVAATPRATSGFVPLEQVGMLR
jgi:Fe-S cluster biogenesis protein NfuA